MDFFDLERLESFRGPQGATYGRNAVGGAVNIVTRRPEPRFAFRAKGGVEFEVDGLDFEGILNTPISSDAIAARLAGFIRVRDGGFYRDTTGRPLDEREQYGARAAIRFRDDDGLGDLTFTLEHFDNFNPSFDVLAFSPDAGDPSPYVRANLTTFGQVDTSEDVAFAEYDRDFGGVALAVVATYKEREAARTDDTDHFLGISTFTGTGNARPDIRGFQAEDYKRGAVEVRLNSTSDGPLSWLLGADFQASESIVTTITTVVANPFAVGSARRTTVAAQANDQTVAEDTQSYSAFGTLTWAFAENFEATGEIRVQRDEKEQDGINRQVSATNPVAAYNRRVTFTEVTPVATLSYRAAQDLTLYGRFSTGFRAGGLNSVFLFQGSTAANVGYDPEYATAYELGIKGFLFNRRLRFELAGFVQDTDNVQLVTRDPLTQSNTTALLNAGDSQIYGAELDVRGRFPIGPGSLNVGLAVSTANGEFAEGSGVLQRTGFLDLSGARVPRTRDFIVNSSLGYEFPIGASGLDLNLSATLTAENGGVENLAGGARAANGLALDDYETLDLRATLIGGRWRLSAYAKNVTDERYRTQSISNATNNAAFPGSGFTQFYSEPRLFGAELSARF